MSAIIVESSHYFYFVCNKKKKICFPIKFRFFFFFEAMYHLVNTPQYQEIIYGTRIRKTN